MSQQKNLGFPDDADLNKMFGFDVKYDNIDDGGIGGTRITDNWEAGRSLV